MRYMINIYTGWMVYDPLIHTEVLDFPTEDDARKYAASQIKGTKYGMSVNKVWTREAE